jgi:hypothetical protein
MATKYAKWPQNIPDGHKIYQMATKYTKWPQNMPNGIKIYQMATKYTKWPCNRPNGHKNIATFSHIRPSKICPNYPNFSKIWRALE